LASGKDLNTASAVHEGIGANAPLVLSITPAISITDNFSAFLAFRPPNSQSAAWISAINNLTADLTA
jgi:hypothetical protein